MQSSSRLCIYIKIDSTKHFAHGFKYNNSRIYLTLSEKQTPKSLLESAFLVIVYYVIAWGESTAFSISSNIKHKPFGFTLVFHLSNILSAVNTSEPFAWALAKVVFVVHVVFIVLKTTADFVLQYRKQQIQLIQLQIVFWLNGTLRIKKIRNYDNF